ncbi:MAG: AAA family ATPase, partial [Sphaerochaetaceae bacterium]
MLVDMTIANFKSVKEAQTISFEAIRDNRLDASKTVEVNEKLRLIRTAAIIGPNGAGKSSFVRALEALKFVVTAPDSTDNPLKILAGTAFAYDPESKTEPATVVIRVVLEKGTGNDDSVIAQYKLVADNNRIYEESLYHIIGRSKKLMFERKVDDAALLVDSGKLTY